MGRTHTIGTIVTVLCLLAVGAGAQVDDSLIIRINHVENVKPGQTVTMYVEHVAGAYAYGGFDLLIAGQRNDLLFQEAREGSVYERCGWEYFTYRFYNLDGPPHTYLLRVVGIAETNNGPNHPTCFELNDGETLFSIDVYINDYRHYNCERIPVRFVWLDCGDNVVSSRQGDSLWIAAGVYDPYLLDQPASDTFPTFNLPPDYCLEADGFSKLRAIQFHNGWIEMDCDLDAPQAGDVNLNDTPWEIADAVVMSNYFLKGEVVLTKDVEKQLLAGDCNRDGLSMTVADMIYMVRIIVGDARPYPVPPLLPDTIGIDPSIDLRETAPAD